jgi:hypothetical protein
MAIKHIPEGRDFDFPSEFGFSGSHAKAASPRIKSEGHDGTLVGKQAFKANKTMNYRQGYAVGGVAEGATANGMPGGAPANMGAGPLSHATFSMPADQAVQAFGAAAQMGKAAGAKAAMSGLAGMAARMHQAGLPRGGMPGAAGSVAAGAMPQQALPGHGPMPTQLAFPTPQGGQIPGGVPGLAKGGHMAAAMRHALPSRDFALPGKGAGQDGKGAGAYPIDTAARARSALSRASANASSAEQRTIRAKVHARYPEMGKK